jgi:hypothetical protein
MAEYESLVAMSVEINAQGKFDFKVEYSTHDYMPYVEEYEVEGIKLREAFLEIVKKVR